MSRFLGLYPRLVSGRAVGARFRKAQPPGSFEGHATGTTSTRGVGLFEGQRPGYIPAYGRAIGIGHRNGRRAEGPVSFPGLLAEPMNRAFSPWIYHLRANSRGATPGWDGGAPLVLRELAGFWASGFRASRGFDVCTRFRRLQPASGSSPHKTSISRYPPQCPGGGWKDRLDSAGRNGGH